MKKGLKITLIVLVVMVGVVLLDTLQARIFNNSPILKVREEIHLGIWDYVDRGIFIDTYYYYDGTKQAIYKWEPRTFDSHKEKLNLENYGSNPISNDFGKDDLAETKTIDLSHTELAERTSLYHNEKELDDLVQYIKENLNVEINNKWNVVVHYYNDDKTAGFVKFEYMIGEIRTTRNIMFTINGNKYDTIYYRCLTGEIDEKDLMERVNLFKSKYVQGKRDLKDDETFHEEHTNFVYYIKNNKLVYSYAYFFQDAIGIINNDWGTIRLIDENGNARLIE